MKVSAGMSEADPAAAMCSGLTWALSLLSTTQRRNGDMATPVASKSRVDPPEREDPPPALVVTIWVESVGVCQGAPTYLKGVASDPTA